MNQRTEDWTSNILEWYAGGDFDVEVAAKLDVSIAEYYRQMNENPAFGRLVQFGRTLSEAFWVNKAKTNMNNKTFNATTWMFVMKNKFNWAEKTEQANVDINPSMNADELRERVMTEAKKLLGRYEPELEKSLQAMAVNKLNEEV